MFEILVNRLQDHSIQHAMTLEYATLFQSKESPSREEHKNGYKHSNKHAGPVGDNYLHINYALHTKEER